MHLAKFPRRRYTHAPTPIEAMPRLSAELGGPQLWVKRDDLLGLAAGGNKTRKLEFVVADALAHGADTLVTVGAVQSNHCRLTLAAARREGLECRLLLEERVPDSYREDASGNHLLFRLLGAERIEVVAGGADLSMELERMADEARDEGRRPYVIPGGASTALGALGYAACAHEILTQTFELGVTIDHVVVASGSGGTHAGLVTGLHASSAAIPVTGVSVRAPRDQQEGRIFDLAQKTATLVGVKGGVPRGLVRVVDDQVGAGYSLPTDAMIEAVRLFAETEGILLDPVYTGKAAAGLVDMARRGGFEPRDRVLFVHTGGSPALYAYGDVLLRRGAA